MPFGETCSFPPNGNSPIFSDPAYIILFNFFCVKSRSSVPLNFDFAIYEQDDLIA